MDIQARSFSLTPSLRQAVEAEAVQFQQAFDGRLDNLRVRLFDANGDRGGIDKGCMISARVGGKATAVVASSIDADMYRAIAAAFTRLSRGARHALQRSVARRRYRGTDRGALDGRQ
jgi:putative sigma-54 modulation protein